MQKLCCVRTRQQFSASLDYFVTSLPPYLHQFSTIFFWELYHDGAWQNSYLCGLLKALYGTLKAACLFWEKFTATLTKHGFQINPYNACVANKTINGHQCTLAWHVDDIKASHKDPKVIDWIIETLQEEYGNEAPLTISCGKVHSYLEMQLDFRKPGKLIVDMSDYI